MATMVDTPVIGLYAATNPERSGPYLSRRWCVNAYADAARKFLGKPSAEIPWTRKIELPGVMELIEVAAVSNKLDELLALRTHERHTGTGQPGRNAGQDHHPAHQGRAHE